MTQTSRARRQATSTSAAGAASGQGSGSAAYAAALEGRLRLARISVGRAIRAESSSFYMLLGTTLFMVIFGLIMVLSSSSVTSFTGDQGAFGLFARQGLFALIGVPLMLVISRIPVRVWRRWAWAPLVAGMLLQVVVLTTPLGISVGQNRNWIGIGSFNAQPSELIKVGLVAWLALILARREPDLGTWRGAFLPSLPVAVVGLAVVMAGGDLGTTMIMASLVFGALYFAGVPSRMLVALVAVGIVLTAIMAMASSSRVTRLLEFATGGNGDLQGTAWQSTQGIWALAAGGVFGVGLGNSAAKWSWLPAADNDFIFAIIGEELGLIGAILVLALFVVLAISFLRILRRSNDLFSRVVTGSVMVWLVGQAFVNVAVVLGLLPVLGVPLPLISSGGSALITTLIGIGLVLSIAREESHPDSPRPSAPTRQVRG
jgi:cell division protein FtsW